MSDDWQMLVDRAQIRKRLEDLADSERLDGADIAFLLFYFRASDPELYQAAALTAGRHLLRSPELHRELSRYAESRGATLTQPVSFIGQRSMRRLVLVQASALASRCPPIPALADIGLPELPFATEPGADGPTPVLPDADADLSNLLLAVSVLARAETPASMAMRSLADPLLLRLGAMPERLVERTVARRWGELAALRLAQASPAPIVETWRDVVAHRIGTLRQLDEEAVAERLETLAALDETIRAVALFPDAVSDEVRSSPALGFDGLEALFLDLRVATWRRRVGGDRSRRRSSVTIDDPAPEALRAAVEREAATTATDAIGGMRETASIARMLDVLLGRLGDRSAWHSLPGTERALTAFLLIDVLRNDTLPARRAAALAARYDLPGARSVSGEAYGETGDALLVSVLLRLIDWEGRAADQVLDFRLVHAIEDQALLAGLLPTARNSRLVPLIADAVENRIRSGLLREPGFDPEATIRLMLVRRPDRAFLDALAAVSSGRTYTTSEGIVYDLGRVLEGSRSGRSPSPGEPVREVTSAARRLQRFLALVGHPDDDERGSAESALSVIRMLQPHEGPLVSAGDTSRQAATLRALEDEIGGHLTRIASAAVTLTDDAWRDAGLMSSRLETLRTQLGSLKQLVALHLPMAEAVAFDASWAEVDHALADWGAGMAAIAEAWTTMADARPGNAAAAWSGPLAVVPATWPEELRDGVATSVLDALVPEIDLVRAGSEAEIVLGAPGAASDRVSAVLDWAILREEVGPRWRAALARLWSGLLRSCMARHDEELALALLRAPRYAALRRDPELTGHLESAHRWLLDRYRPLVAHFVDGELAHARGASPPGLGVAAVSFAAHYVAYWIGLLVGAILLLDFGDAWTEMAEQGDVPGIMVTFLIGVSGTYAYLLYGLKRRVSRTAAADRAAFWWSLATRSGGMLALCLMYTLLITSGLWFLLSGTDAVVHGPMAIGHIIVWAGFALFIGIFFGLIAKQ